MSRSMTIRTGGGIGLGGATGIFDPEEAKLQEIKNVLPTIKTMAALNAQIEEFKALSTYKQAEFFKTYPVSPGLPAIFLDKYLASIDFGKLKELFAAPYKEMTTTQTSSGVTIGESGSNCDKSLFKILVERPSLKLTLDKFVKKIQELPASEFIEISKILVLKDSGVEEPLGCLMVLNAVDLTPYIEKLKLASAEERAEFLKLHTATFAISAIFRGIFPVTEESDDACGAGSAMEGWASCAASGGEIPDIGSLSLAGEGMDAKGDIE